MQLYKWKLVKRVTEIPQVAKALSLKLILKMYCGCNVYFVLFVVTADVSRPKEVMLGTVKIPLADLIHKRTGMLHFY